MKRTRNEVQGKGPLTLQLTPNPSPPSPPHPLPAPVRPPAPQRQAARMLSPSAQHRRLPPSHHRPDAHRPPPARLSSPARCRVLRPRRHGQTHLGPAPPPRRRLHRPGYTPLMWARSAEATRTLIHAGASVHTRDHEALPGTWSSHAWTVRSTTKPSSTIWVAFTASVPFERWTELKAMVEHCAQWSRVNDEMSGSGSPDRQRADRRRSGCQRPRQRRTYACLLAHNLTRERADRPKRTTNSKRSPLWVLRKLGTIRHKLLRRVGRLTRPPAHS